jgi:hypothetical protein
MPKAGTRRPAAIGKEAESRAINATNWQPMPGMVKRQCDWCCYYFAAPTDSHGLRPGLRAWPSCSEGWNGETGSAVVQLPRMRL